MSSDICRKCGVELVPEVNWHKSYSTKKHKDRICKTCKSEQNKNTRRTHPANLIYRNMKRRSLTSFKEEPEWTLDDVKDIIDNGKCAITNIKFRPGDGSRNPYAASPDRIDCSKGYTRDNVRWVCLWVNYAMHEFGDEIFYKFIRYVNEANNSGHRNKRAKANENMGSGDAGLRNQRDEGVLQQSGTKGVPERC